MPAAWKSMLSFLNLAHDVPGYEEVFKRGGGGDVDDGEEVEEVG